MEIVIVLLVLIFALMLLGKRIFIGLLLFLIGGGLLLIGTAIDGAPK